MNNLWIHRLITPSYIVHNFSGRALKQTEWFHIVISHVQYEDRNCINVKTGSFEIPLNETANLIASVSHWFNWFLDHGILVTINSSRMSNKTILLTWYVQYNVACRFWSQIFNMFVCYPCSFMPYVSNMIMDCP